MQVAKRLQQTFAHVGKHRGGRLAPAHQPGVVEIDGGDFCESAAEINEDGEGGHTQMSVVSARPPPFDFFGN
jgi:hypothetical protein